MHVFVGWLALSAAAASPLALRSDESPPSTESLESRTAPARETILIEAEKLVVRPGKILENARVLVRDGRIRAVGTDIDTPEGARVVRGAWVCAAFLDPWSALGIDASALGELGCTPATRALDGVGTQGPLAHLHEEALRAGVTVVRVQSGAGARIGGLGAVVRVAPGLPEAEQIVLAESNLWMSAGLSQAGGGQVVEDEDGFRLVTGERAQDPFERTETVAPHPRSGTPCDPARRLDETARDPRRDALPRPQRRRGTARRPQRIRTTESFAHDAPAPRS